MPGKKNWLVLVVLLMGLAWWVQPAWCKDRLGSEGAVSVEKSLDQAIQQKLAGAFQRIEQFQGLSVEVSGGVAVLTGRTPLFNSAEEAVELASRIAGVLYVVDDIEVETDVDSYISPAWRKMRHVFDQALNFTPLLAIAVLVFLVFFLAGRLVTRWDWLFRRFGKKILLQGLVRQLIRYFFVFAGLLAALDVLGLTALLGAFAGAAGVIGLALGFGFKDIVENYIAGFLLSIRSPFVFMDWIQVDRHQGSVVRVTSRELVLMNLEGNHVRIPNSQVFKSVIYNYTRNPLRRFDIDVGIGVEEDLSQVQRIGVSVLEAMKGVVADPGPGMRNLGFGDSAMLVSFFGWVNQTTADFIKVQSEAIRMLKEALDAAGIDVPVPIQRVVNVAEAPQPHTPRAQPPSGERLLEDAGRADVDRESYLGEQIERDRQKSGEEDLLTGK